MFSGPSSSSKRRFKAKLRLPPAERGDKLDNKNYYHRIFAEAHLIRRGNHASTGSGVRQSATMLDQLWFPTMGPLQGLRPRLRFTSVADTRLG
jgi:hypothetical protein